MKYTSSSVKSGDGGGTVFSAALNNINFLSGGVDPQTGLFSSVITFGTLYADRSFGSDFPLKMTFNPMGTLGETSSYDALLGKGWELDLPSYNASADLITLPGGKTYKVNYSSWSGEGSPWELSHKAPDITVFGTSGSMDSKEVTIRMKSGEEFLLYSSNGEYAYMSRYTSPDGRYFEFDMREVAGGVRLDEVTDNNGDSLASFTYGDSETTVVLSSGTPSERKIVLNTSGADNTLSFFYIEAPGEEDMLTDFDYKFTDIGSGTDMASIEKITHPSGATETLEYYNSISLPQDAPWDDFPAVSMHTRQHYSNGPVVQTEYELGVKIEEELGEGSQHNFFGNGLNIDWEDATDSLANHRGDYTYSNVVTEGEGKKTTYTYNKFHQLLVQEETFDDGTTKKTTFSEYYGDASLPLDEMTDVRYELVQQETVRYEDSNGNSKDFVTVYDHDDYGNVKLETLPDSTSTAYTYYPAAGESDGGGNTLCPAHPFGMETFVKTTTESPNNGDPGNVTTFTYKSIEKIDGDASGSFVVVAKESFGGTDSVYNYYNDKTLAHHGLLKNKKTGVDGSASVLSYEYVLDESAGTLKIVQTLSSESDATSISTSETKTWANDQTVEEVNEDGVSTTYTYDTIGRVRSEVRSGGTDYEITTNWTYSAIKDLASPDAGVGSIGWCIQEETSASGSKSRTYLEQDRNEFMKFLAHDNGTFFKTSQTDYDELGRKSAEYRYDYEMDGQGGVLNNYEQSQSYQYGVWNEVKETVGFNGMVSTKRVDPFSMQVTDYAKHPDNENLYLNPHRSTFNLFKEKNKIEVMDDFTDESTVYSTQTYAFDGFGRQKSQTSATGNTTTYGYDAYDRIQTVTYPDGSFTTVAYESGGDELISSVKVTDSEGTETVIGTKTYDGVGRMSSKTVNGATWNYEYDPAKGSATNAWRVTNARQQSMLFEYVPGMDALQRSAASTETSATLDSAKVADNSFAFATGTTADGTHPIGSLMSATGDHGSYNYTYTANGKVKTATQVVNGKPTVTFDYQKYTVQGKPLAIQVTKDGADPIDIAITYDQFGRLHTTTQNGLVSEYSYDLLGRVYSLTIYEAATGIGSPIQTTVMQYNPYNGMERKRTTTVGGKVTVQEYVHFPDNLIKQRTTTVTGTDAGTLVENFTYDGKGRLSSYEIADGYSAGMLPTNEHGQAFVKQEMVHNALDNLKTMTVTFPNQDVNTSTYTYEKTRLKSVTNSLTAAGNVHAYPATVTLDYNADGDLISVTSVDGGGATLNSTSMTYNPFSRVSAIDSVAYAYDCFNRLVSAGDDTYYYKGGDRFLDHNSGGEWTSFMTHGVVPIAEFGAGPRKILGTDASNTVFSVTVSGSAQNTTYSPQGIGNNSSKVGYTGEFQDIHAGGYHLGNGTRLYLPHLGIFNSMDSKSPFSIGGVNPYRYCQGDPVNFSDPSGQSGIIAFLISAAIGVAVAAAAEGIRAGISGTKFNWKGFLKDAAFSIATAGVGTALTTTKAGAKITASATKALSAAVKSTRATSAAAQGAKKAGSAISKTGKRAWASTKKAGKSSYNKARGKGKSKNLEKQSRNAERDLVREKGYVGTMTDIESGKKFEFLPDKGDLLIEEPGKMDKFFEVSGQSYLSLASKAFTLGKAVVEGFNDREESSSEGETNDTQSEPVYIGESFAAYYGDE